MTPRFSELLSGVLLVAGLGLTPVLAADDDSFSAPDRSVTLDAASRAHLGITTVTAQARAYRAESSGLGQVLGLDVLAQTDADLSIAESAAQASDAALKRAQGLFNADTGISRQALETAQHQATTDTAQLSLAQRKATASWGRDAPWRTSAERRALMAKIGAGTVVILKATFPTDIMAGGKTPAIEIVPFGRSLGATPRNAKPLTVSAVWSAPADPAVPGRTYYMLVEGAKDLADGDRARVIARSGEGRQGAFVPSVAIIVAEGSTWLYIEEKPDYFVRQAADISQPSGEGYVLPYGVQAGEKVVTAGAGHLLAKETGTEE